MVHWWGHPASGNLNVVVNNVLKLIFKHYGKHITPVEFEEVI